MSMFHDAEKLAAYVALGDGNKARVRALAETGVNVNLPRMQFVLEALLTEILGPCDPDGQVMEGRLDVELQWERSVAEMLSQVESEVARARTEQVLLAPLQNVPPQGFRG